MSNKTQAGMIGLGIMGSAITQNLLKEGISVAGYDIDNSAMLRFTDAGGTAATSPGQVAQIAPIVLLSLPSVTSFQQVVDDIALHGNKGCIVVDCSTLPIPEKQKAHDQLAKHGITLLDCPLSGTGAQAVNKDLVVLGSGDESAFIACQAVFDGFSRETRYLGEFGNGMKMKYIANLLVSIHNASAAEAMVLARKAGLDPQTTYDVISSGAGSSRMFEVRGPMMVDQVYEPATMKIDVWRKDVELITAFANELDCPTPLFSTAEVLYASARGQGKGNQDTASINAVLENMAGLEKKEQG